MCTPVVAENPHCRVGKWLLYNQNRCLIIFLNSETFSPEGAPSTDFNSVRNNSLRNFLCPRWLPSISVLLHILLMHFALPIEYPASWWGNDRFVSCCPGHCIIPRPSACSHTDSRGGNCSPPGARPTVQLVWRSSYHTRCVITQDIPGDHWNAHGPPRCVACLWKVGASESLFVGAFFDEAN